MTRETSARDPSGVNGNGKLSIGEVRLPCYDLALTNGRSDDCPSAPCRFFGVRLTGGEWYDVLRLFRSLISAEGEPGRKRTLVLWSEKISLQLRPQGF
jgi:hypothetical protein